MLQVVNDVQPETLVRWHRAGFRRYWCWKSRLVGGRPQINAELCALIRRMSMENPLWGAPRIHGELLKLGFEVAESSVCNYMVQRRAQIVRASCAALARIRRMSMENPLWGAPRMHGELLKLGFEVAQSSVSKYMVKRRGPSSQGWRTFLRNHRREVAAIRCADHWLR